MAKYFKLVEISQAEFIKATGEDLDAHCCQVTKQVGDGPIYTAIADEQEELEIDLFWGDDEEDE